MTYDFKGFFDIIDWLVSEMTDKGYRYSGCNLNPEGRYLNISFSVYYKGNPISRRVFTLPQIVTSDELVELKYSVGKIKSAAKVRYEYRRDRL